MCRAAKKLENWKLCGGFFFKKNQKKQLLLYIWEMANVCLQGSKGQNVREAGCLVTL